jgi:hypothetical protein
VRLDQQLQQVRFICKMTRTVICSNRSGSAEPVSPSDEEKRALVLVPLMKLGHRPEKSCHSLDIAAAHSANIFFVAWENEYYEQEIETMSSVWPAMSPR